MDKKQKQLIQLGVTGEAEDRVIFLLDMSKGVITFGYECALLDIFSKTDIRIVKREDGSEPLDIRRIKYKEAPVYVYADKAIITTRYKANTDIKLECRLIKIDEAVMTKVSEETGILCKGIVSNEAEKLWSEYLRHTAGLKYKIIRNLKVLEAADYINEHIGYYSKRYTLLKRRSYRISVFNQLNGSDSVKKESLTENAKADKCKAEAASTNEVAKEVEVEAASTNIEAADCKEETISANPEAKSTHMETASANAEAKDYNAETISANKNANDSKQEAIVDKKEAITNDINGTDTEINKQDNTAAEHDEQADFISDTFGVETENKRKAEKEENDRKLEEASRELLKLADGECTLCNGSGLMAGKFGTKTICRCIKERQKRLLDEKALEEQSSKPVYHATLGERNNITALKLVPEEHKDAEFEMNRLTGKGGKLELLSIMHKSTVIDNGYIKGLSEILSTIQFRNKLKHSYLISAPNGYSKTTFVYTCIRLLYLSGKKAVPYISILQLMELLSDYISEHSIFNGGINERQAQDNEESIYYKWKDYLNADIAFVELTANGFETIEGQMLKTLLSERGRRNLPTIAVTERAFNRYVNTEEQKKLWANMVTTSICNAEYDRMVYIRAYELMQAEQDGKYILELGTDRSYYDAV